jgi:hypothetical protein
MATTISMGMDTHGPIYGMARQADLSSPTPAASLPAQLRYATARLSGRVDTQPSDFFTTVVHEAPPPST